MPKVRSILMLWGFAAAVLAGEPLASAAEFTYSDKTNAEMAKKLDIPVFFTVPKRSFSPLPASIKTSDKLIEFRHPDANGSGAGLRLVVTKRSGMAKRLGASGLFQTGDILLSMRPEWGGAIAYTNIQMGISHAGIAYLKDGVLHNLDNPMNDEFLGSSYKGLLTGTHYESLRAIHVMRPRGLTDQERANLQGWIDLIMKSRSKIYPAQVSFNTDYNKPKYHSGKAPEFVKHLGQIALGINPAGSPPLDMFCSEFVWSLLSLRDCDPKTAGDAFKASGMPACIRQPMKPMLAVGDFFGGGKSSYPGLADGPPIVVESLGLPKEKAHAILHSVFTENLEKQKKISQGHLNMSKEVAGKFALLETYYIGSVGGNILDRSRAYLRGVFIRNVVPENYSPTGYYINALMPSDYKNRTMDYVATILIE